MFCKGQFEFYIVNRTRVRETQFREFTKISKSITDSYLKDFDVFAISRTGYCGCVLMPQKGVPVYFDDLADAAAFLSDRIGKVKSQNLVTITIDSAGKMAVPKMKFTGAVLMSL